MKSLGQLGEQDIIKRLQSLVPNRDDVKVSIGDDAAVVGGPEGYDWLLTSDVVLQDRHFTLDDNARDIGHKAVGRVLSDLAAMGGEPCWGLVDVVAPAGLDMEMLEDIYRGGSELADQFHFAIVGGDLSEGESLGLHVFGVGKIENNQAALRSTAKPGDMVFVTGSLGGSGGGRHLRFQPRVREGRWLVEHRWVSSMIDVSDGLATDLHHLVTGSGVGAEVMLDRVPVHEGLEELDSPDERFVRAATDGEDFELLFTVPENRSEAFLDAWTSAFELPCTAIGKVNENAPVITWRDAEGQPWEGDLSGYQHFGGGDA